MSKSQFNQQLIEQQMNLIKSNPQRLLQAVVDHGGVDLQQWLAARLRNVLTDHDDQTMIRPAALAALAAADDHDRLAAEWTQHGSPWGESVADNPEYAE